MSAPPPRRPAPTLGQRLYQTLGVSGPFAVDQEHEILGPLQLARDEFEAAASRFATDAVRDAKLRQQYMRNIQRISREVQAEVDAGRVSVVQGANFCQRMRNQIMEETRVASSAQGQAYAQAEKPSGKTLSWLLNKYSKELFKRPYASLIDSEKGTVFYAVIEAAGRDRVRFSAATRRLSVLGKVGVIVTAILAVHAVVIAEDLSREMIRQGAAIGGGFVGGALAGSVLVAPICGPGAVICAVAVVLIGSVAGSLTAMQLERTAEDEWEEFARWNLR